MLQLTQILVILEKLAVDVNVPDEEVYLGVKGAAQEYVKIIDSLMIAGADPNIQVNMF